MPKRSKRYEFFEKLEVNKDTYLDEMSEIGLITTGGMEDPRPSIRVKDGQVIEMDEKPLDEFDIVDHFIARYSIDVAVTEEAMEIDFRCPKCESNLDHFENSDVKDFLREQIAFLRENIKS